METIRGWAANVAPSMATAAMFGTEDSASTCFGLSRTQRLGGFLLFIGAGLFLSFMTVLSFYQIVTRPAKFLLMSTLANIFLLSSPAFLVGPMDHVYSMFKENRRWATVSYIAASALALYSGIVVQNYVLSVISTVLQFAASAWYIASYIPFAQTLLRMCFSRALPT
eukprot:TRINITY_DN1853_c0_g1_i1.p1 TRINITY_DN1853_c0_g1~~TRINITY_DN1853_c0_g1_i1.p1  ORF type:complete len:167 (+),score=28.89 TRINITY_DN1853_c0_g1_i1:33-533(+)